MKKNLDFVPAIAFTQFDLKNRKDIDGFIVTAPHHVTELLWDVARLMDDQFGVFSWNRENDTELHFWINPGYDLTTFSSILFTAVYIATTYQKDIDAFWKIGLNTHIDYFAKKFKVVDYTANIDEEVAAIALSAWITSKASSGLDNIYSEIGRFNLGHSEGRINTAYAALLRLQFLDPSKTSLSTEELAKRIKLVTDSIGLLEDDFVVRSDINEKIKVITASAYQTKQALKDVMSVQNATQDLYDQWQTLVSVIRSAAKEVADLMETVDRGRADKLVTTIERNTPSAPKSK